MTNVDSMDYMHSHPSTFPSLPITARFSSVSYSHHTYLLWHFHSHSEIYWHATYHCSIYYDTLHHCHIALHDHVVEIVFVAKPPFIFFHTCHSWFIAIPVHHRRHSHRVIFCSKYWVVNQKVWWSSLLEHCPKWGKDDEDYDSPTSQDETSDFIKKRGQISPYKNI